MTVYMTVISLGRWASLLVKKERDRCRNTAIPQVNLPCSPNFACAWARFSANNNPLQPIQEQAPPSHKNVEPKDIRPKSEARNLETRANQAQLLREHEHVQSAPSNQTDHAHHHLQKKKRKSSSPGSSKVFVLAEALAGTALAFVVQFFHIRSKDDSSNKLTS